MRTHRDHRGSEKALLEVAPITEHLPFRPAASWYEAYWYRDRPARRGPSTDDRASASSVYPLVRGFVAARIETRSRAPAAPVSEERAEQASGTHRPRFVGGR